MTDPQKTRRTGEGTAPATGRLGEEGTEAPRHETLPPLGRHGGRGIPLPKHPASPSAWSNASRYSRMFPALPAHEPAPGELEELSERMLRPSEKESNIPAGYTYVGQLIAHDLTFRSPGPLTERDPGNLRTPLLDLDCLYGGGPRVSPHLYSPAHPSLFLIGGAQDRHRSQVCPFLGDPETARRCDTLEPGNGDDLLRNYAGTAVIPDPRNDSNTMISQIHLALQKAHNRCAQAALGKGAPDDQAFESARREVTWAYQWLIVQDYLQQVLDEDRAQWVRDFLDEIAGHSSISPGRRFVPGSGPGDLPIEFAVAAFRFGHSMVRRGYKLNFRTPRLNLTGPSTLPREHLLGGRALPEDWTIDWRFFFAADTGVPPQQAAAIDTHLVSALEDHPDLPAGMSLPYLTLRRGNELGLPSGQTVAAALGLKGKQVVRERDSDPLWWYLLHEADELAGGNCLGPVGSMLVAEVLVEVLVSDPSSYIYGPKSWDPTSTFDGQENDGKSFSFYDLLTADWPAPLEPPVSTDP